VSLVILTYRKEFRNRHDSDEALTDCCCHIDVLTNYCNYLWGHIWRPGYLTLTRSLSFSVLFWIALFCIVQYAEQKEKDSEETGWPKALLVVALINDVLAYCAVMRINSRRRRRPAAGPAAQREAETRPSLFMCEPYPWIRARTIVVISHVTQGIALLVMDIFFTFDIFDKKTMVESVALVFLLTGGR
jgi:hypothetical protein